MSTIVLRSVKGTPLTNTEIDTNFNNLNTEKLQSGNTAAALTITSATINGGAINATPIGLTTRSTIAGTTELIGPSASANFTRFPNALAVVSNIGAGLQQNEAHNIGLLGEGIAGTGTSNTWGVGLYGVAYTTDTTGVSARAAGVVGEAHVSATGDTLAAVGVRGYANDTHAGGSNVGLFGDASGGAANYALFLSNGDVVLNSAKTWTMAGNQTFSGAYIITIPTLNLTNALGSTYGGTGVNNAGRTLTISTNSGTISFTSAVTLTVANTASVSGTNTGDQTTVSGNAGSATVLATSRNINGVAFDGSAAITVTAAASTLTDTTLNATVVTSSLTSVGTLTSLTSSGAILSTGVGGVGYATGAGGTVTQSTSKATPVTLSKATGTITLAADVLNADTTVSFVLTNTAIAATDLILIQHQSGGTLGSYNFAATPAAGSATIYVRNVTAGSLSEAILLRIAIIKSIDA